MSHFGSDAAFNLRHPPNKLRVVLDLTQEEARQLIRLLQRQADESVRLRRFATRYGLDAEPLLLLTTWEQLAEDVRQAVARAQQEQLR